jgi:hypothetical protein
MLLFRGEEHVVRWGKARGATMTPQQMWRLADAWYRDRADLSWRRRTAEEAESMFAQIGLTGDFWRLRAPQD